MTSETIAYSLQPAASLAEILFFIVAMYAIGFGWAWFAEQAKGLTGTVSCRCGKRQVTGIAPRAHPDFTKLLTANCPACCAAQNRDSVGAVPSAPCHPFEDQGRPERSEGSTHAYE